MKPLNTVVYSQSWLQTTTIYLLHIGKAYEDCKNSD